VHVGDSGGQALAAGHVQQRRGFQRGGVLHRRGRRQGGVGVGDADVGARENEGVAVPVCGEQQRVR